MKLIGLYWLDRFDSTVRQSDWFLNQNEKFSPIVTPDYHPPPTPDVSSNVKTGRFTPDFSADQPFRRPKERRLTSLRGNHKSNSLATIADIWHYEILSGDDPSRCKLSQRGCREVVRTRTHENVVYLFANEGVPVSRVASRRSVYVLQFQTLETELATVRCSQLLRVCRA